jgi:tetratricopeptide (TPR) repeat protein
MRSKLGESLTSVQKYDAPAESVTTPSLEALKAYSLGYKAMLVNSDFAAAIPLFQQAISLDPKFGMAYARMGTCYFNLDETLRASENLRSAYELRSRVSERERLYIASHYETFVTGDLNAARRVYELSAQTYPHDTSFANMGLIYSNLGEYDKALPAYQQDVKLNPGIGIKYGNSSAGTCNSTAWMRLARRQDKRSRTLLILPRFISASIGRFPSEPRVPTTIFSRSGKTPIPTSPSSEKQKQNTLGSTS